MNHKESSDAPKVQEYLDFLDGFQTVILATADEHGEPEASYAPFVRYERLCFYVYLSELARHTRNLRNNGRVSLLWLAEEGGNPFARPRLVLRCNTAQVAREAAEWAPAMARLEQRFGNMMKLLKGLSDFHLFRLCATGGTYVKGFAQAYELVGERLEGLELSRGQRGPSNR
jgi:putative heme iron utilization protein